MLQCESLNTPNASPATHEKKAPTWDAEALVCHLFRLLSLLSSVCQPAKAAEKGQDSGGFGHQFI